MAASFGVVICFQIFDTNLVLSQPRRRECVRHVVVICFQIFDTNLVLSQHISARVGANISCDLLSDF
jgi:hypothetical protein